MSAQVPHRYGPYGGQYVPETLMPALASSSGHGSRHGGETSAAELALLAARLRRPPDAAI
jgi:tryptophan synthase beta subunit